MTDQGPSVPERLAHLAYQLLFPSLFPDPDTAEFGQLLASAERLWSEASADLRRSLQRVRKDLSDPLERNDAKLVAELRWMLAAPALEARAGQRGLSDIARADVPPEVQEAMARVAIDAAHPEDEQRIRAWLDEPDAADEQATSDEEGAAMTMERLKPDQGHHRHDWDPYEGRYTIDPRNLPENFDPGAYTAVIEGLFRNRNADLESPRTQAHAAYVTGSLIRASYFETTSPGFEDAFVEYFNRGFETVDVLTDSGRVEPSRDKRQLDVYGAVAREIYELKDGADPTVQEVAAVADDVLDRGPVNDGNFAAKVRSAHDDYVSLTPVYDSLELPDIVTDDTAQAEVEPTNIRAVAMIYAAGELENAQLIAACDQAAQDWSDGVLPVGENAGRLFDSYVWEARDRLDTAARTIQFERVADLNGHMLRFCSATSERDRAQYLSEYLAPGPDRRRAAQPRDAAVRKAARDLLAYASLHGWAYTQFAAKRLGNHIRECVEIIDHPEVQKAYGVQGPWQVVERVSAMTTGSTPNIQKHRALASTGKAIIDMLAAKAKDIAASLAKDPLFPPGTDSSGADDGRRSIFDRNEYEVLLTNVENWLAANLVNDRQRMEQSQLRESAPAASLPSFGGTDGGIGFDSNAVKDQLMQMVSTGQLPTADQVEQMFRLGS